MHEQSVKRCGIPLFDDNFQFVGSILFTGFDFYDVQSGYSASGKRAATMWRGKLLPTSVEWYNRGPPDKIIYLYDPSGMIQ